MLIARFLAHAMRRGPALHGPARQQISATIHLSKTTAFEGRVR
jgi:hypothetical protein